MALKHHLYIAQSADGFIADASGGLAWLDDFSGTDYGYDAFYAGIDGLIIGRKTYDQVMGMGAWPYPGKPAAVLTRRPIGPNAAAPVRACPTIADAGAMLESAGARTVWIVGGGETIAAALREGIQPERIEVFVMPIVLGEGVRLWAGGTPPLPLELQETETYPDGVVRIRWGCRQAA